MLDPFRKRQWHVASDRTITLGPQGHLMGVVNVTPDSFSDGGKFTDPQSAAIQAVKLANDGATIIDIGAESTKPNADTVDGDEEQARLIPALEAIIAAAPETLISLDTYRASTAEKGLAAGAHIVNDVWGLQKEPDIARVAAEYGAGIVIMHTNRGRDVLSDVIEDQKQFFGRSLRIAEQAGLNENQIMLDPGFGFGKETAEINIELMNRFAELHALDFPFLIGTSRKRFLGTITGRQAQDRDMATAATTALLRKNGAAIFRVHDINVNADALKLADALIASGQRPS
jgi:dihydropteroate synthase